MARQPCSDCGRVVESDSMGILMSPPRGSFGLIYTATSIERRAVCEDCFKSIEDFIQEKKQKRKEGTEST